VAATRARKRMEKEFLIRGTYVVAILLLMLPVAGETQKARRDYVPDQKTAERIAEAVLIGQYGEERVSAERPLIVDGSNKEYWIVQGAPRENGMSGLGDGPAVWINKHTGCLKVLEHMK